MTNPVDRSRTIIIRTIWMSGGFIIVCALLLIVIVADHVGIMTLPSALKPYCGPHACDYAEVIQTLVFMTLIGVVLHLFLRLVRYLFAPD